MEVRALLPASTEQHAPSVQCCACPCLLLTVQLLLPVQSKDRLGGLRPLVSEDVEAGSSSGSTKGGGKMRTLADKLLHRGKSSRGLTGADSRGSLAPLEFGGHALGKHASSRRWPGGSRRGWVLLCSTSVVAGPDIKAQVAVRSAVCEGLTTASCHSPLQRVWRLHRRRGLDALLGERRR